VPAGDSNVSPPAYEKNAQVGSAESAAPTGTPAPAPTREPTPPPLLTPPPIPTPPPMPSPETPAPAGRRPSSPVKHRPSLAVLPFTIAASDFWKYYKEEDVNLLTDKFITALVNTNKFDVIERRRLDDLTAEQRLSQSGAVDPGRLIQTGKLIGADYVVMGSMSVFKTGVEYKNIPYTSKLHEILTADVIVDLRVVEARTGRILAAEKGDVNYTDKAIVDTRRTEVVTPRFLDDLQRAVVDQLTQNVVATIYPVKVSSSRGGIIFLNRGAGGDMQPGDLFQVFSTGHEIRDPDTNQKLGFEEIEIGTLRVTDVAPEFSKAMAVTGGPDFPVGSICRRSRLPVPATPTPRGPQTEREPAETHPDR